MTQLPLLGRLGELSPRRATLIVLLVGFGFLDGAAVATWGASQFWAKQVRRSMLTNIRTSTAVIVALDAAKKLADDRGDPEILRSISRSIHDALSPEATDEEPSN